MAKRRTEVLIGAAALFAGAVVIAGLYAGGRQESVSGYPVTARFPRSDGISIGSEVRLSGITVGKVVDQKLDENYRAVLTLRLDSSLQLTLDTAALIHTDGLLGPKYIALQPGGDERMIPPGGEIAYTQEAIVIEDLLASIIAQAKARRSVEEQGARH